jgi:putative toxin-antitoxin system antitoxin component (TIGR02293 family)
MSQAAAVPRPRHPAAPKRGTQRAPTRLFEPQVSGLRAHDLVTRGITVADARQLLKSYKLIDPAQLYAVLGITPRTLQRRAASTHKTLDANASDRALRLLTVTALAIDVLGSQQAAEAWLTAPAMGLDRRLPIELLRSTEGTELVKTLLTRMDFGVYA